MEIWQMTISCSEQSFDIVAKGKMRRDHFQMWRVNPVAENS